MKKGFQLSATFIVILIIMIVIFVGSLYFLKQFFTGAQEIKAQIDYDTKAQIEELLREPGAKVAIPINKATLRGGQQKVFGLGIRNVGGPKEFWVTVESGGAFKGAEALPVSQIHLEEKWLLYGEGPYQLEGNAYESIPIVVSVDDRMSASLSTESGTYVFNVCVWVGPPAGHPCQVQAQRYSPSEHLYDKIHQISIAVP